MDTINKDKSNLLYAFHKTSKLAVQKQNQTLFANQRKKENIMFIGEKKIDRPFRWGIVGAAALPALVQASSGRYARQHLVRTQGCSVRPGLRPLRRLRQEPEHG